MRSNQHYLVVLVANCLDNKQVKSIRKKLVVNFPFTIQKCLVIKLSYQSWEC